MSPITVIIGIGMFTVVTMILTAWGIRKKDRQKAKLANMLLSKSADHVMHYLKDHETVSEKEMRELVDGLQVREFGSPARAVVEGNQLFVSKLIEAMLHDGLIEAAGQEKGKPIYKKAS